MRHVQMSMMWVVKQCASLVRGFPAGIDKRRLPRLYRIPTAQGWDAVAGRQTEAPVYILAHELRHMHQQHGYAVHGVRSMALGGRAELRLAESVPAAARCAGQQCDGPGTLCVFCTRTVRTCCKVGSGVGRLPGEVPPYGETLDRRPRDALEGIRYRVRAASVGVGQQWWCLDSVRRHGSDCPLGGEHSASRREGKRKRNSDRCSVQRRIGFHVSRERQTSRVSFHICHRRWHDCGLGSCYQFQ